MIDLGPEGPRNLTGQGWWAEMGRPTLLATDGWRGRLTELVIWAEGGHPQSGWLWEMRGRVSRMAICPGRGSSTPGVP